jgi:error-prone DNA polymerase
MYVELHVRSAFSFLEGASLPEQLAKRCGELQMPALALLDRDGVYGAPRMHLAAKEATIKAHVGAAVTLSNSLLQGVKRDIRYPLLAETQAGYQNLCRLITRYKSREKKKGEGFSTAEEIREYSRDLVCLTGGEEGPLAAALQHGGMEAARQEMEKLVSLFGPNNVYVELQRHCEREEEYRNRAALEIAEGFKLPILATNGVRYAKREQRFIADVFTCLRHKRKLDTAGRLLGHNAERYLRSPSEMEQLFRDLPDAIENTAELSGRLQFSLENLGYEFPKYPVAEGDSIHALLRRETMAGARHRYGELTAKVSAQLEHELLVIEELKLGGYFLIVWDIVRFCNREGIFAQGRGSAANSAVCYSLGITAVDPVGMKLLFERFLSKERGEYPDIDIDLPSGDDREKVIQYVYKRYGSHGAAMTANVITYRRKSASREMGKVLGISEDMVDRLSHVFTGFEWRDPDDTLERSFLDVGLDISHPMIRRYVDLCWSVMDLPRHLGQHSGGMIVCQGQLSSVVPLEPATMEGRVVCQWDKDDCAALDLIKIDLLGLGMLKAMKNTLELIPAHYDEAVDIAHLPQDDPLVFSALQKADAIGVFQLESRAQLSFLPRLFPKTFYDIVISTGSIRPGPIQGDMINPLIKRRQGRELISYPHPILEETLARTYGVILFQEQALQVLMRVANFTAAEAEQARRAMTHKRSRELMDPILKRAREGMCENKIDPEAQERIVHCIESFLGYAFPESHAYSFGLIAYASGYLKCHYLAAFTAGLLNAQPMGFYAPSVLIKDAQAHGLQVKPIDILRSDWDCILEQQNDEIVLRLGFRYVRKLREESAKAIEAARQQVLFEGIPDLTRSVPGLRKDELQNLAACGALNPLDHKHQLHRRDALWQVAKFGRPTGPLFQDIPDYDPTSILLRMTDMERLITDHHISGFTIGRHAMAYRREDLNRMNLATLYAARNSNAGEHVKTAGEVTVTQRPGTAKGIMFMTLHDETGYCDVVIKPAVYRQYRTLIKKSRFLCVQGKLQKVENAKERGAFVVSINAMQLFPLDFPKIETRRRHAH